MCERIQGLRSGLRQALEKNSGADFAFIEKEKGMFSFLGPSAEQAIKLRITDSAGLDLQRPYRLLGPRTEGKTK